LVTALLTDNYVLGDPPFRKKVFVLERLRFLEDPRAFDFQLEFFLVFFFSNKERAFLKTFKLKNNFQNKTFFSKMGGAKNVIIP